MKLDSNPVNLDSISHKLDSKFPLNIDLQVNQYNLQVFDKNLQVNPSNLQVKLPATIPLHFHLTLINSTAI